MTVEAFPTRISWHKDCILGDNKKLLPIVANALIALRRDPTVRDAVSFDEMASTVMLMHELGQPFGGSVAEPRPLTDQDVTYIQEWMQKQGLQRIGSDTVRQAIELYAREQSYHP